MTDSANGINSLDKIRCLTSLDRTGHLRQRLIPSYPIHRAGERNSNRKRALAQLQEASAECRSLQEVHHPDAVILQRVRGLRTNVW